jgi:hypothetical protein
MEVWYGNIYTKKETLLRSLYYTILLVIYQPMEGAVRATGVASTAAKSKG